MEDASRVENAAFVEEDRACRRLVTSRWRTMPKCTCGTPFSRRTPVKYRGGQQEAHRCVECRLVGGHPPGGGRQLDGPPTRWTPPPRWGETGTENEKQI